MKCILFSKFVISMHFAEQVEPCCWMTYTAHRDTQATLQILDKYEMDTDDHLPEDLYKRFGLEDEYACNDLTTWQRYRPKVWAMFELPHSSVGARVSGFSLLSKLRELHRITC